MFLGSETCIDEMLARQLRQWYISSAIPDQLEHLSAGNFIEPGLGIFDRLGARVAFIDR
jgi:hypothetical protein